MSDEIMGLQDQIRRLQESENRWIEYAETISELLYNAGYKVDGDGCDPNQTNYDLNEFDIWCIKDLIRRAGPCG